MSDCRRNSSGHGLKTEDVQSQGQPTAGRTREELVEALTENLELLDADVDITHIDEILREIDSFGPVAEDFDVEASFEKFCQTDAQELEAVEPVREENNDRRGRRGLARIAIIAAALVCLAMTTVQASGFNIFAAIIDWANEKFYISSEEGSGREDLSGSSDTSLQEALDESGIRVPLVPKEFPADTVLVDLKVKDMQGVLLFSAVYDSSGIETIISIRQVDGVQEWSTEIDTSNQVESYVAGGVTHSLAEDVKQQKAVWRNDKLECSISTGLNREQLMAMIDSIYS